MKFLTILSAVAIGVTVVGPAFADEMSSSSTTIQETQTQPIGTTEIVPAPIVVSPTPEIITPAPVINNTTVVEKRHHHHLIKVGPVKVF
ncbi:MAG: hypothetical protein ACRD3W_31730 [Terriglobales bacterium]